jgi:glutathione S-transferase
VICEYLCHHAGDKALLPDEPVAHFRVLTLQALAVGLMDSAVALRYETGLRPEEKRWPEWIERQHVRLNRSLDDMDVNWQTELAEVNLGAIASASLLAYLDFRYPDLGWQKGRPGLVEFQERFMGRASMQATHPE